MRSTRFPSNSLESHSSSPASHTFFHRQKHTPVPRGQTRFCRQFGLGPKNGRRFQRVASAQALALGTEYLRSTELDITARSSFSSAFSLAQRRLVLDTRQKPSMVKSSKYSMQADDNYNSSIIRLGLVFPACAVVLPEGEGARLHFQRRAGNIPRVAFPVLVPRQRTGWTVRPPLLFLWGMRMLCRPAR